MLKRILFFVFTIGLCYTTYAQPESARTEVRNGATFYVHEVVQGNTLWGLQSMYKTDVNEIIKHNPFLEYGLKVGQLIYIPVDAPVIKPAEVKPNVPSGQHVVQNVVHVVAVGETVYGISRKYQMTPEALLALNPEAVEGISIGQVLVLSKGIVGQNQLPKVELPKETQVIEQPREHATKVIFKDSLVEHTVLPSETLYSISKRFMVPVERLMEVNQLKSQNIRTGDKLIIPLKKESISKVSYKDVPAPQNDLQKVANTQQMDPLFSFQKRQHLRVAVLLPMHYGNTVKGNAKTRVSTQFYAGVKMALDTLQHMGLNAKITLYDTQSNSDSTAAVLSKMSERQWDLIIGPLFNEPAALVTQWAKEHRVPVVMPTPASPSYLKMNPYCYLSIPSDARLMHVMGEQLVKLHAKDNIILINTGMADDQENYDALKNKVNSLLGPGAYRQSVKEVSGVSAISGAYVKGMRNVFIYPGKNKSNVLSFMKSYMSFLSKNVDGGKSNVFLYGMREWEDWSEITVEQKGTSNYRYTSATAWIPNNTQFNAFARRYRSKYKDDPTKVSFQGYDVVHHFIRHYYLNKSSGYYGVINDFSYIAVGDGHGYENRTVFLLGYVANKLSEITRVQ